MAPPIPLPLPTMPPLQGLPHDPRWAVRMSVVLALFLLAAHLAMRVDLAGRHIFDLLGAEENVVYSLIKVLGGGPLYSDPEALPFDITQYTPAYYILLRPVARLLGIDGGSPHEVYQLIRWAGLGLNLLFVAIVHALARRMGAPRHRALLWSVLLLILLPRQVYSRPDTLSLLLFAASMALFLSGLRRADPAARRRLIDGAVVVGALAPFAKQSGVLALLVIGGALLFGRQWRALARATALGALVVAIGATWCCLHYGTEVFHANVVKGIRNGTNLQEWTWTLLRKNGPAVLACQLIGLVLAVRWLRRDEPSTQALGVGIVITWLFALLTSLKQGSSQGYYTECLALCVVAIATEGATWRLSTRPWAPWALLLLAFMCVRPWQVRWGAAVVLGRQAADEEQPAYARAQAMAMALGSDPELAQGLVLLTAHDPLENFIVGRSVLTQKDILLLDAAREQYDLSAFNDALENGGIHWVIATGPVDKLPLVGRSHPPLEPYRVLYGYHVFRNSAAPDPQALR